MDAPIAIVAPSVPIEHGPRVVPMRLSTPRCRDCRALMGLRYIRVSASSPHVLLWSCPTQPDSHGDPEYAA